MKWCALWNDPTEILLAWGEQSEVRALGLWGWRGCEVESHRWMVNCDHSGQTGRCLVRKREVQKMTGKFLAFKTGWEEVPLQQQGREQPVLLQLEVGFVYQRLLKAPLLFQCRSQCRGWGKSTFDQALPREYSFDKEIGQPTCNILPQSQSERNVAHSNFTCKIQMSC